MKQNENDRLPVPAGWRLVPVEPTKEMKRAAVIYANGPAIYKVISNAALEVEESSCAECYRAMLDAAPAAPVQPMQAQGELVAWISNESLARLACGGNDSRRTVPVHAAETRVSKTPLYLHPPRAENAALIAERDALRGE